MPRADQWKRLKILEQRYAPRQDDYSPVAEALGLSKDDPLVDALEPTWCHAAIVQWMRRAGKEVGDYTEPDPILEAIGLPRDATDDAILEAARVGFRKDPAGFRERVLAVHAKPMEPVCRFDPVRSLWIDKGAWWVSPEQWARSVTAEEAARLPRAGAREEVRQ